jgi:hypothetical protein
MALTPRQIRAAELLAKGHSQQAVGDQVGVSRRTILRWLKEQDFKNLSYGLAGRGAEPPKKSVCERSPQPRQRNIIKAEDLVPDALGAVQVILQDPDARNADKLKAAALVGQWSGLERRGRLDEIECLKVLIEADWIGGSFLDAVVQGGDEFIAKVRKALGDLAPSTQTEADKMYEDFNRQFQTNNEETPLQ